MKIKEFKEWKERIDKGEVGILFVQPTGHYLAGLQMELEEYGFEVQDTHEYEDEEEKEEFKDMRSGWTVTLVGINNKLGRFIRLNVTKELAEEFQKYQDKLIKEAKKNKQKCSSE